MTLSSLIVNKLPTATEVRAVASRHVILGQIFRVRLILVHRLLYYSPSLTTSLRSHFFFFVKQLPLSTGGYKAYCLLRLLNLPRQCHILVFPSPLFFFFFFWKCFLFMYLANAYSTYFLL